MNDTPIFKFALRDDLVNEPQFIPTRGEPLATGWDVKAAPIDRKDIALRAGQYCKIPLGFRCYCPPGWWYQLHPRSSSFVKKSMHSLIGIIDESYPSELILAFDYLPDVNSLAKDLIIKFGDAIGQIIPVRRQEMITESISNEEFDRLNLERNAVRKGGIGSTDKQ